MPPPPGGNAPGGVTRPSCEALGWQQSWPYLYGQANIAVAAAYEDAPHDNGPDAAAAAGDSSYYDDNHGDYYEEAQPQQCQPPLSQQYQPMPSQQYQPPPS